MESALIDLYDEHFKIMFRNKLYILQQKVTVFVFLITCITLVMIGLG